MSLARGPAPGVKFPNGLYYLLINYSQSVIAYTIFLQMTFKTDRLENYEIIRLFYTRYELKKIDHLSRFPVFFSIDF